MNWCWSHRKYVPGDLVLEELKEDAGETKKRLWVDPAAIPSWVYRKIHGRIERNRTQPSATLLEAVTVEEI